MGLDTNSEKQGSNVLLLPSYYFSSMCHTLKKHSQNATYEQWRMIYARLEPLPLAVGNGGDGW